MPLRFSLFLLLAALGGAAITVQAGLNAQVARTLGHPLWATMVSLVVSIISILPLLVAFRVGPPHWQQIGAWAQAADRCPRLCRLCLSTRHLDTKEKWQTSSRSLHRSKPG